jgi:hypothetical protein
MDRKGSIVILDDLEQWSEKLVNDLKECGCNVRGGGWCACAAGAGEIGRVGRDSVEV